MTGSPVKRIKPFPDCHCGHVEKGHAAVPNGRFYRPCRNLGCRCIDYRPQNQLILPPRRPQRRIRGDKPDTRPSGRPARSRRTDVVLDDSGEMNREQFDALAGGRLSEDAWRTQIREYAVQCGFRRQYHTQRSDRSDPGWPDDVLSNGLGRMPFIESKKQSGQLTWDQIAWLDDLAMLRDAGNPGIEVYCARPSDQRALWNTLDGDSRLTIWGVVSFLHQWCLLPDCARCQRDRDNATLIIRGRGGRIVQQITRARARGYIV